MTPPSKFSEVTRPSSHFLGHTIFYQGHYIEGHALSKIKDLISDIMLMLLNLFKHAGKP